VFKAPSLRNVGLTGPYMHDGRFDTLAQVVDFYDHGIQDGPALDDRLRQGGRPQRLHLDTADRSALVAFLMTLTDRKLTTDPRFSNPFRDAFHAPKRPTSSGEAAPQIAMLGYVSTSLSFGESRAKAEWPLATRRK
jgi:cytochrome c peroxidase